MRAQLIRYIDLLFAGAPHAADIKQEILQNTLDRYDDLIAQGKSPEAAYSLSIAGIGDISEILGSASAPSYTAPVQDPVRQEPDRIHKQILRAVAVALYIISPIPLFILSELHMDVLGLCGTLGIIAFATVLILLGKRSPSAQPTEQKEAEAYSPRQELRNSIKKVISTTALCIFLVVSFLTQAWFITWIIFPLSGAVRGLVFACMDLKEASEYEN